MKSAAKDLQVILGEPQPRVSEPLFSCFSWQETCDPKNRSALWATLADFLVYIMPDHQPSHHANGCDQRILYGSCAQRSSGQTKSDLSSDLLSNGPLDNTTIRTDCVHRPSS